MMIVWLFFKSWFFKELVVKLFLVIFILIVIYPSFTIIGMIPIKTSSQMPFYSYLFCYILSFSGASSLFLLWTRIQSFCSFILKLTMLIPYHVLSKVNVFNFWRKFSLEPFIHFIIFFFENSRKGKESIKSWFEAKFYWILPLDKMFILIV